MRLNASLTQRLSLREAEIAILAGIADSLKKAQSPEQVLDVLLYRCLDAAGVSKGTTYLLDQDGRLLLKAQLGFPAESTGPLEDFFGHASLLWKVMKEAEPLVLARDSWPELFAAAHAESILLAPLIMGGESRGVVGLISAERRFQNEWVLFVKAVGSQIGQAVGLSQAMMLVREGQERLERILATMADGLLIAGRDGRFTFANSAAERILGLSSQEIIQRTYNDARWKITTVDDKPFPQTEHPFARLMQTGEPVYGVEQALQRPGGERIVVLLNAAPFHTGEAEPGAVISLTDVTDHRRAGEALEQQAQEISRYNAELEEFNYAVAHDLQQPLRTVASFTQLLQRRYTGKLDAEGDQMVERVVGGCIRMRRLIEDLLAYARVARHPLSLQPVDSGQVFQEALSRLAEAVAEAGAVVTRDSLPTIQADPERLERVFQNLIDNAIKFRSSEKPRVHVSARRRDNEWVFSVQDNGIGVEEHYRQQIFGIFHRLHGQERYPGTGIGLALCKRIVERHQGRMWVEPAPAQGSLFCFSLPAAG